MSILRNTRGSIAVEFALIAPLMILLWAAMAETSLLGGDYQRVTMAAEAGAQAALRSGASEQSVYEAASAAMGKSDASGFSVSVRCEREGGWYHYGYYYGGTVAVDVSYAHRPLSGAGLGGEWPLTATSYRAARDYGLCYWW
jgi:hypothetical protein